MMSEETLQEGNIASERVGAEHCDGRQKPVISEQFGIAEAGAVEDAATGRVPA